MSILHTINKSPFEKTAFSSCLGHLVGGSSVLMIEDGVYGALQGTSAEASVKQALDTVKVYVLGPDLKARGFSDERIIPGISVVDYPGFVDLATEHDKVQAWL